MITQAIYELLNVANVTSLATGGVHPNVAPQDVSLPYVVWSERGVPENWKDDYSIVNYDVTIDIYTNKGKDGGGGYLQANGILEAIKTELDRYKGTIGGSKIDQVTFQEERTEYDDVSNHAHIVVEFRFRVDE